MPAIERLDIDGLRNLTSVSIRPSPHCNLVCGANGSGKTSLLEAIHILALGRSFRSRHLDPLIQTDSEQFQLFARFDHGDTAGVRKSREQRDRQVKFNGELQRNWQQLITALPVQLFNADSFQLLEGGARVRRRFLDWGVFHVEHGFLGAWQAMARALKQRNALLKRQERQQIEQLKGWTRQFLLAADTVSRARERYFERLQPYMKGAIEELSPALAPHVAFDYYPGWQHGQSLEKALDDGFQQDLRLGATGRGPHRADIRIRYDGYPAERILSRGQQKLLVCAMKVAEIRSLLDGTGKAGMERESQSERRQRPVLLIDDLAAELDQESREKVVRSLLGLGAQCFFTAIEAGDLWKQLIRHVSESEKDDSSDSIRQFHVEHGKIYLQ